jgi:hypothetical protein
MFFPTVNALAAEQWKPVREVALLSYEDEVQCVSRAAIIARFVGLNLQNQ